MRCLSVVAEGEEVGHAVCTYAVGEDRRRWMEAEEASEAVRRWKRGERPRRGEQRGEERAPRPPTLGIHTQHTIHGEKRGHQQHHHHHHHHTKRQPSTGSSKSGTLEQ